MIADRYLTLMHAEIDGANSPGDSRLLAAYLDANEEARRHYHEMRAAVAMLENATPYEPPSGLRRSILAATAAAGMTGPRAAGPWLLRRPGYAYAFAAGLVIGMVLLGTVWPRLQGEWNPTLGDLYGSVAPDATVIRDLVIDEPGLQGRVRFGFSAERVTVRVALEAEGTVRLDLTHDNGLTVEDLRVLGPAAPGLAAGPGSLALEHAGQGVYEIVLRGDVAARRSVAIALRLDGDPLLERVIEPK